MTDTEKYKKLFQLTTDVRQAQKNYFRSRTASDLKAAKEKEQRLDKWLKENEQTAIIKNTLF